MAAIDKRYDLDRPVVFYSDGRPPRLVRDCVRDNRATFCREQLNADGKVCGWITADAVDQLRASGHKDWPAFGYYPDAAA